MKNIILIMVFPIITMLQLISCDNNNIEEIAVINLKFDSNIGNISIIETVKNDTSIHLDTLVNNYLLSKTNDYKFQLELKKDNSNGDYLIYSDECENSVIISEVQINEDLSFSYLFNGSLKTEKDRTVFVTYDMLCNQ